MLLLELMMPYQVAANSDPLIAHISPTASQLDLSPYVSVLVDREHALTIEDLSGFVSTLQFRSLSETGNSFGFDKAVYWARFSIKFDHLLKQSFYLHVDYPMLDSLILFSEDGNGGFTRNMTGDNYPFKQRDLSFRNFLFELHPSPSGSIQTYYLRLQTQGSMQIPLTVWSSSALIELADSTGLAYGFFYGVMIVLMLAAAVAYLFLRDFLFLSYALYLLSFMLFQLSLNGFGYQYLWPEMSGWVNRINAMSIGNVVVFGFLFCGTFLRVWQQQDRFRYFYYVLMGVGVFSMLLSLFGDYSIAVVFAASAGILMPPVVLVSTIHSILAGYRPARFFLLAWGIFLMGVFSAGLVYFGWIERDFYTHNSMQIASLIEVLILGYVLMQNVRQLNLEKISATQDASKYLEQLNQGLEALVEERTRELNEKNSQLSDLALHDSMTGLLNHNASIEQLNLLRKAAQRYGYDFSVVMIDIDFFKAVNDRYGHPAGDQLIIAISQVLTQSLRESDVCGRYGGEEFILLLPETSAELAINLAQAIRLKIAALEIAAIDNTPITASFGVAVFDSEQPKTDLISKADKALYKAKESGRNRVVFEA